MINYPIQMDLQGEGYKALVDFLGSHATHILLVSHAGETSVRCQDTLRRLHDLGETVERVREWPGTRLYGAASAFVHRFPVNAESLAFVKGRVNSLFSWRWPEQPEDLCFLNLDNIPLLMTTAHEAYAELSVSDGIKIPFELEEALVGTSTRRKNGAIVTLPSRGEGLYGRQYVGVEGTAWPVPLPTMPARSFGLAWDVETTLAYWNALKTIPGFGDAICLYLNGQTCLNGFRFAGFDCGYYGNENDNLSVILNELLLTKNSRFADFKSKLNAYGLFDLYEDAVEFMRVALKDDAFHEEYGGCLEELSVIKVSVHVLSSR